ncbi:hypothetical protein EBBID32_9570 [Sphingobium indicum BiD32]|uniref:Uncharacterized protein n=1 Tax=Sphingobium indicum BiD32 TaxID=1301087 RepID=N1MHC8_9SPHN|nr:hypothetical protein EBBID32_9570 [Sphingobium indicum BiD32]
MKYGPARRPMQMDRDIGTEKPGQRAIGLVCRRVARADGWTVPAGHSPQENFRAREMG